MMPIGLALPICHHKGEDHPENTLSERRPVLSTRRRQTGNPPCSTGASTTRRSVLGKSPQEPLPRTMGDLRTPLNRRPKGTARHRRSHPVAFGSGQTEHWCRGSQTRSAGCKSAACSAGRPAPEREHGPKTRSAPSGEHGPQSELGPASILAWRIGQKTGQLEVVGPSVSSAGWTDLHLLEMPRGVCQSAWSVFSLQSTASHLGR